MRIAAVGLVLVVALASALLTRTGLEERDRRIESERARAAEAARGTVERAYAAEAGRLAERVAAIAQAEALRLGITTDEGTVANQLNEEGLKNLRAYEISIVRRPAGGAPDGAPFAVLHGLPNAVIEELDALPAVHSVLAGPEGTTATATVGLPGGAALLAFCVVTSRDGVYRGWVAVGERLTTPALAPLVADGRAAVLLSDGAHPLAYAGPPELAGGLEQAVGHESDSKAFVDGPGLLAARPLTLGAHTWLWVAAPMGEAISVVEKATSLKLALIWIGALVVALAGAAVLYLRGRKPAAANPLEAWAGVTGNTPPVTNGGTVIPVMLPNGQMGQLSVTGQTPMAGPLPVPGITVPRTPAADPTMFGRYKLLERLGAGGMAEVWTAVVFGAGGFQRPFVVKRILAQHAGNQDLVQQFIDEANLASQLVHSNVVPVFDFGNLNGEYYLAQEYILGRDLGKIVQELARRGRTIDGPLAAYVCAEVLKALDYAHTLTDKQGRPLNVVHRDISPNNILVSGRGEVKLIDFGIAKSDAKVAQTEIGTVKGNIRFMAPEQARGELTDPRTDLFSLGASLYFALRGEALYTVSGQYEQLLAAANGPTEVERQKIAELPAPMNTLLETALAPLRESRFASAQAFLEALQPSVPADGPRRLAALVQELFGEQLARQEQQFAQAASQAAPDAGPLSGSPDDATVQRARIKQGVS